jgi:hypothetical protein
MTNTPRLIRTVKLARVPYDELDEGDEYQGIRNLNTEPVLIKPPSDVWDSVYQNEWVAPTDTTKYPPESVTYTIEGIPEDGVIAEMERGNNVLSHMVFSTGEYGIRFDESEIETRYI